MRVERLWDHVLGLLAGLLAAGLILLVAGRPVGQAVTLEPPPPPAALNVHVAGAVSLPGVYALAPGSMLQDALDAAGGTTPDADISGLNLAQPLVNGIRVLVPARPTPTVPPPTPDPNAPTPPPAATSGLININTASLDELDRLPGIGPGLAQRIIDHRTTYGPFAKIEDLQNVSGIGPSTFEKLKDLITVQ